MSSDDLERLLRWEHAGGLWDVAARSGERVTLSLCRCDGGEEMDRFTSGQADLVAYVDAALGDGK